MREKSSEKSNSTQIKLVRKYLKLRIQEDDITFRNHSQARIHVYDLVKRAIVHGESHSALVIGPRGCGKTTLINSVLHQLSKEVDLANDALIIKLNGLVHHDEKMALKSITAQMQLENAVDGKVFGTFAEQLAFLLSCLTSGADRRCRSMVFILDECDMFCRVGRPQTLLYNLFDITHSGQAPMCVLGLTNRIDVMDLLEKRVKSRFSHRHIYIFPNEDLEGDSPRLPVDNYREILVQLLSVPVVKKDVIKKKARKKSIVTEDVTVTNDDTLAIAAEISRRCKIDFDLSYIDSGFAEDWNAHVKSLSNEEKVIDAIEKFCYYSANEQVFKNVLFQLISKLKTSKPYIDPTELTKLIDNTVAPEHRVMQIQSLSILELSLVIAMLHGSELLDYQPLNFEMVLHRYQKFASANSSTQSVPRPVILKAFEHLQELEIIVPAKTQGEQCGGVQKEHRLHALAAPAVDIRNAVHTARALPTEILHWLDNSIV